MNARFEHEDMRAGRRFSDRGRLLACGCPDCPVSLAGFAGDELRRQAVKAGCV